MSRTVHILLRNPLDISDIVDQLQVNKESLDKRSGSMSVSGGKFKEEYKTEYNNKQVVVKVLHGSTGGDGGGGPRRQDEFFYKLATLSKTSHPNMVDIVAVCLNSGGFDCIAVEFVGGIVLGKKIVKNLLEWVNDFQNQNEMTTNFKIAYGIFLQISSAMQCLESLEIPHCDLVVVDFHTFMYLFIVNF